MPGSRAGEQYALRGRIPLIARAMASFVAANTVLTVREYQLDALEQFPKVVEVTMRLFDMAHRTADPAAMTADVFLPAATMVPVRLNLHLCVR